jgi:beta-1,4-mannosyl-glycoprotein beta-1,4-N-acetylglucosaminyltransferase
MRYFILFFLLLGSNPLFAKIYDCFMFFNELEILEIRLAELYDHVDHFVIVESEKTFRGQSKPLYFLENRDAFQKYEDKIIHIVISGLINTDPWKVEAHQRNQIMQGLTHCNAKDIILISDVDELIRATTIPLIKDALFKRKLPIIRCAQVYYRYYLNTLDKTCPNSAETVATTYEYLQNTCPEELRRHRHFWEKSYPIIPNAGWHFTSIGGVERYAYKLGAFSHAEQDTPKQKHPDFIKKFIKKHCIIVPIDSSFPKLIQEKTNYYKNIEFIY